MSEQINPLFSVQEILQDNWNDYLLNHQVAAYVKAEVSKTLSCYGSETGYFVFYCTHCQEWIFQHYGCNSRLCSCCGKRYADQWSASLAHSMFKVPHRHIVFSIPCGLWSFLQDPLHWKDYMDCVRTCFVNYIPLMLKKIHNRHRTLDYGIICVLHPFGKDIKFHPHLHLLVTEGGFDEKGTFHRIKFFPANGFRRCWQFVVLRKFQELGLANQLAEEMYRKYPKGFYVWVHKDGRINNLKQVGRYVGRYIRHPAIANRRITQYNGSQVSFYYDDDGEICSVTLSVDDFITKLIKHIPPPHFKMIRYYCAYGRRKKRMLKSVLQSSIKQSTLFKFGLVKPILCPYCGKQLVFIMYLKKPPPEELKIQRELNHFIS